MLEKYMCLVLLTCFMFESTQGIRKSNKLCFNQNFAFGVATAAYQIEGAWNISGKGESIWDRYTHEHPERVFDHKNGDIAADSYHFFKEDVKLLKALNVSFYRFSISWPRLLPSGLSNEINQDGVRYYMDIIDELERNNIQPLVTMYHWDLPQSLQDLGGWTNPIMANYFLDYAKVLFSTFGHKVQTWITFNEPLSFCHDGYGGDDAPGGRSSGFEDYMCGHNVLRAHGMVYHLYEREFKEKQHGFIGITLDFSWLEPATTSESDKIAAETARQFNFGWFANPIFTDHGDYPPIMRARIDAMSKIQGYPRSRLPTFTKNEVRMIRGSYDFLGLNHYTTYLVSMAEVKVGAVPSFYEDAGVKISQKEEWPKSNSTWLRIVPWGFRKSLNWIKNTYNNPLTLVTENGVSLEPGLHDLRRVNYLDGYLKSLHSAIEDGCHVIGYTYWSLLDNYEWMRGYFERFGLYEVDYDSPNRTRTARLSASYFNQIASTGCIPDDFIDYNEY